MHLGNLSLAIEGTVFRILPVYDMCSMGFAPQSGGDVLPYSFTPPRQTSTNLDEPTLLEIRGMGRVFWERVAADERISDEFREFLGRGNPIDLMS